MTIKEMRESSVEQLDEKVKELKQELFNLKLQKALEQLENTAKIKEVRREIARIKTIATEKGKR